jgi:SET domain-containing protein
MHKRLFNRELKKWVYSSRSQRHGTGLFANKDITEGQYIGTYHGPTAKRNGTYVLWVYDPDDENDCIGISGQNLLRYLNHDKANPNTEFESADLFALRDIKKDEELCFNYGEECGLD